MMPLFRLRYKMDTSNADSANLILRLYETRRESVMREARIWFSKFFPESIDDILHVLKDEQSSAYFRMVISYWDMAASFVNYKAIDEDMFNASNGEHILVFCKMYSYVKELRELWDSPKFLANLEELVMRLPDAENMLNKRHAAMKEWIESNKDSKAI